MEIKNYLIVFAIMLFFLTINGIIWSQSKAYGMLFTIGYAFISTIAFLRIDFK